MTGRGAPKVSPRPVTPPDPTLQSRRVPRFRQYTPRYFGPGSSIAATHATTVRPIEPPGKPHDEVLQLLQNHQAATTTSWREDGWFDPDPSWGFYVFRTAYSDTIGDDDVALAMQNLVQVQHRALRQYTESTHVAEACQRFKLSLIESRESLADASDDRVREEFRAVLRGRRLAHASDEFPPPARNNACIKLDDAAVDMLADLDLVDDASQDLVWFENKTVRMIDIRWERPQSESPVWGHAGPGFRGVMDVSIASLMGFYADVTRDASYMMEMHPTTESS